MTLVPPRTVPLVSDLPPGALLETLRGLVGTVPAAPFAGQVDAGGFRVTRMRDYRSTHLPVLEGRVEPGPGGGSRVLLRLRPPAVTLLFMAIWLGFLAAVAGMILASRSGGGGRSPLWLLAPGGLAGLSYWVMASVFAADARWALAHLLEQVPALGAEDAAAAGREGGRN